MTILEDPHGAVQSYGTVIVAWMSTICDSQLWGYYMSIGAGILLTIRLYKEIKGLIKRKKDE